MKDERWTYAEPDDKCARFYGQLFGDGWLPDEIAERFTEKIAEEAVRRGWVQRADGSWFRPAWAWGPGVTVDSITVRTG